MGMTETVKQALKAKAPGLYRELEEAGTLRAFLEDQAEEINQQIATLTVELAGRQGANKAKSLQEKAAILKAADATATEIVLAEMLRSPWPSNWRTRSERLPILRIR